MSAPHPSLSAAERLAWRAAGWLMTGACGALTVWGFTDARRAAPAGEPVVAVRAPAASSAGSSAGSPTSASGKPAERPQRRGCGATRAG
jgi:hypothetical protein